jgi:hypothetical protein
MHVYIYIYIIIHNQDMGDLRSSAMASPIYMYIYMNICVYTCEYIYHIYSYL